MRGAALAVAIGGAGLLFGACGGRESPPPSAPAARPTGKPAGSSAHPLDGATVFDKKGEKHTCEQPRRDCPPVAPDTDFTDRCRLSGYQVRLCGCESYCAGDVGAGRMGWDADGQRKECLPAKGECDAPPASAAFQDACTDRGFKLKSCACEWLCTGDHKK